MKNIFRKPMLAAVAALLTALTVWAIPARPGAFLYTQPDGRVISLERHGDEFFSWTTLAGTDQVMVMDADGFYRPGTLDRSALQAGQLRRRQANQARNLRPRTHNDNPMTHGERHIPVLLANFSDVKFRITDPQSKFDALLNQQGYSANGGTGSVRDFYVDNSQGAFVPVFDVYGPVTLPNKMSYYGAHYGNNADVRAEQAVIDAARALDNEIDFSQYDYDGDGMVDMVLFYYAGYNEAEGGSANSIWPHQWTVRVAEDVYLDGKLLDAYFCTSELKGSSGASMCGIGTTCHEFGHSLGLPDFYDTDYATNGTAGALYSFSIMCSGSYNNNGCTPPYFNSEERIILGWMTDDDVPPLPQGAVTIGSVKENVAYRSYTSVTGEYFVYECRDGSGWDAPLPSGMVVYHVDKAKTHMVGGISAYEQWYNWEYYNSINAYGAHPCFYLIPAASQQALNYSGTAGSMVFPGSSKVRDYNPTAWGGKATECSLSGIAYAGGQVTLNVLYTTGRTLTGTVTGQNGQPVQGVRVALSEKAAQAPRHLTGVQRAKTYEQETDSNGIFVISLEDYEGSSAYLTFSKEGYQTQNLSVSLLPGTTSISVTMLQEGETEAVEYKYYDPAATLYYGGYPDHGNSQMAAIRIPAAELPEKGGVLLSVDIIPYVPAASYYIVADAGGERILTYQIPNMTGGKYENYTVDLSDMDVTFYKGRDLYVGVAVKDAVPEYAGYTFLIYEGAGNTYYAPFDLKKSSWNIPDDNYGIALSARIAGRDMGEPPFDPGESGEVAAMGANVIYPGKTYTHSAGEEFPLILVESADESAHPVSVQWYYDGRLTKESTVVLTAGEHEVKAVLALPDGSTETLKLRLEVE